MCPDWLQELNLELQTMTNEPGMVTTSTGTVREPWITSTSTAIVERNLGLPSQQQTLREPWITSTSTAIVKRSLGLPTPQDRKSVV